MAKLCGILAQIGVSGKLVKTIEIHTRANLNTRFILENFVQMTSDLKQENVFFSALFHIMLETAARQVFTKAKTFY